MAERNLVLRVASAVVGLPLLGFLILWRDARGFSLFALVAIAVGLSEYTGLLLRGRPVVERAGVIVIGVAAAAGVLLSPRHALLVFMAAVVACAVLTLFLTEDVMTAPPRLAVSGFGVVYVGLLVALPLMRRDLPSGSLWVILAIAVTFANDTGAYAAGRTWGRHKLAPRISPGKTVEGAIGGLVASVLFLIVARATFFPQLTPLDCMCIGAAAGFLGPCGDLVESMMKRSVGAKDSGHLIPGHGGLLDRVDALMFVAAYVYTHALLLH